MRSEIVDAANVVFAKVLEALERDRLERASNLVEEARRRLGERGGDPLPPFERLVDYSGPTFLGFLDERLSERCRRYNLNLYLPPIAKRLGEPDFAVRRYSGDEVIRRLRSTFARFPDPPTPFQWKIFEAMLCAAKALIYGQEYDSDPNWVLERNGWSEDNDIVAVLTGRKTGKTTGLAMAHLAFMMVIRGYRSVNASRTLEQSMIVVDLANQLAPMHPMIKELGMRIEPARARRIAISSPTEGWTSTLEAVCGEGNVRTLSKLQTFFFLFFCAAASVSHYPKVREAASRISSSVGRSASAVVAAPDRECLRHAVASASCMHEYSFCGCTKPALLKVDW